MWEIGEWARGSEGAEAGISDGSRSRRERKRMTIASKLSGVPVGRAQGVAVTSIEERREEMIDPGRECEGVL